MRTTAVFQKTVFVDSADFIHQLKIDGVQENCCNFFAVANFFQYGSENFSQQCCYQSLISGSKDIFRFLRNKNFFQDSGLNFFKTLFELRKSLCTMNRAWTLITESAVCQIFLTFNFQLYAIFGE